MTYFFRIGEAVIVTRKEDSTLDIEVLSTSVEACPLFIDSGKENFRHPGYSQWEKFCTIVGLHKHFFDKEKGILKRHPGIHLLAKKDLTAFKKARASWLKKYPEAKLALMGEDEENITEADWIYYRLVWLCFWTEWALKNCEKPIFTND